MALSFSWNNIAATQTDADSPLDEVVMEALRQNQIYLQEVGTYGANVHVSLSGTQTLSTGVWTTIAFNTEQHDNNSDFNTGTYTFTPTIEGIYVAILTPRISSTNLVSGDEVDFRIQDSLFKTYKYIADKNGRAHDPIFLYMFEADGISDSYRWGALQTTGSNRYLSVDSSLQIFKVGMNTL